MDIEVVRPGSLQPSDAARWAALRHAAGLTSPFFSPDWVRECARAEGPDSRRARVAILRDSGRAVGFLPARISRFAAQPVGRPHVRLSGDRAGSRLQLPAPRPGQGAGRAPAGLRHPDRQPGRDGAVHARSHFQPPGLPAPGLRRLRCPPQGGRQRRAAGLRQEAPQDRPRARRGALHRRLHPPGDFDTLLDWKRDRYAATGQTDIFKAGWPLRLIQNLFASPVGEISGKLFTLHAGERLLATHYALCDGQALHAWFISHDLEASKYSPGVVLIADILKWAAAQGMAEFDLGAGDYRFKRSLASVQREVAYGYVGRFAPATAVRATAYGVRRAAESLPLGRASAWPGKAMRRVDLMRGLRGGWSLAR